MLGSGNCGNHVKDEHDALMAIIIPIESSNAVNPAPKQPKIRLIAHYIAHSGIHNPLRCLAYSMNRAKKLSRAVEDSRLLYVSMWRKRVTVLTNRRARRTDE